MIMGLLPEETSHAEDRALHDDVRWLGSILGKVIRRLEGQECFNAVERLRMACRARRQHPEDASLVEELLSFVESLPLEIAAKVARAFTLFFLLINTAEQAFRVRLRQSRPPSETASGEYVPDFRWIFEHLKEKGRTAEEVLQLLLKMEVSPVLTAHPTEPTRHTILDLQTRVAKSLLSMDKATPAQRLDLEQYIEAEIEVLWLTAETRRGRSTVLDEISNVLWYLEHHFLETESLLTKELRRAFREVYRTELRLSPPLRFGSWVGGDRDGNSNVTPDLTLYAARQSAHTILGMYRKKVHELIEYLSLSESIKPVPQGLERSLEKDRADLPEVWQEIGIRHSEEPIRLKLGFTAARLETTQKLMDPMEPGRREKVQGAYPDSSAFEEDLLLVANALGETGAGQAREVFLDPLLTSLRIHGFYGYRLDVREEATVHSEALEEICRALDLPTPDRHGLERELLGRRPLIGQTLHLTDRTRKVVDVFRVIREAQGEISEEAVSTYVISMAQSIEDVLRVLLLAREAGLADLSAQPPRSRLDVVPLFETYKDLMNAPQMMRSLFSNPAYRHQLEARKMRQEVMMGYSDSTKDVGLIPASWALYRAQERLVHVSREAGVDLVFFHGRGGTVGRGGGSPVFRALLSLPAGTVQGRIKITEQGEVVSQKYGLVPIGEESLEALLTGTLLASFKEGSEVIDGEEEKTFREVMDRLSGLAMPVYKDQVYGADRLFRLFLEATPVRELAHLHFGSRPAYRESGVEAIERLRAIPWVFGWTQMRFNLPAWLGTGTALGAMAEEPGSLELLQRMARAWPFFDDLLGKLEMICAKTDLTIARTYVQQLKPESLDLFESLEAEFQRAVRALLRIRESPYLLMDQPMLQTALAHRDQYIDPLSFLQIVLLRRKRRIGKEDPFKDLLQRALNTTVNGIAQGLKNTA
jgi:phosphoenolpyruvate carboxylase